MILSAVPQPLFFSLSWVVLRCNTLPAQVSTSWLWSHVLLLKKSVLNVPERLEGNEGKFLYFYAGALQPRPPHTKNISSKTFSCISLQNSFLTLHIEILIRLQWSMHLMYWPIAIALKRFEVQKFSHSFSCNLIWSRNTCNISNFEMNKNAFA